MKNGNSMPVKYGRVTRMKGMYRIAGTIAVIMGITVGLQGAEQMTLEDCISLAEKQNATLITTRYDLDNSRIDTKDAYGVLYPGASLSAGTGTGGSAMIPDGSGSSSIGVSVNQALYTPGLLPGLKSVKINEKNAEIDVEAVRDQIRTAVSSDFYRILSSQAVISVYRENIQVSEENIRKIRTMYELGTRTESDVLKSEVQKGDFEAALITELQSLNSLKRSLNVSMGRQPDEELELAEDSVTDIVLPDQETAVAKLRKENTSLRKLEGQKAVSTLQLKAAKEGYFPTIGGSYSYSDSKSGSFVTKSSSVGLSLSLNLFDRFQTSHSIQKGKILVRQLDVKYDDTVRQLEGQLADLYTQYNTYTELIRINEIKLESSKRDLDIVTQQYQIGSSTILDQMNAQLSVLDAQSSLVKQKYSKRIIESQIIQLIGR